MEGYENMVILFGAGNEGRKQYQFLTYLKVSKSVDSFCDTKQTGKVFDKVIYSYEDAKMKNSPFVISVSNNNAKEEHIVET